MPSYFGKDELKKDELKGKNRVPLYLFYAEIAAFAFGTRDGEKFYYERLGQEGTRTFISNLYPVACRGDKSWPPEYFNLFGFRTKKELRLYVENTTKRFQMLREYARGSVVVCHGKTHWITFKKAFFPQGNFKPTALGDCNIEHSDDYQVILVPFLGHGHISYEKCKEIGRFLRKHHENFLSLPAMRT